LRAVKAIPMTEIAESIEHTFEERSKNPINSRVALFVAIAATVMALCNVKDGNIVQAMSQAQAHALNAWSYFEAKSTKENITLNALETAKLLNAPGSDTLVKMYQEKIERYEREKAEIKAQAQGYEKEYDALNLFDDQFDMTEALLTIAIAMFGITALTQKRWLLYFSSAIALLGIILGLAAFLKVNLHSDLVSRILG
jgi:hypothetical protein